MSYSFYFEDGHGNVADENGDAPMDINEDEDPFKLEELTSHSAYVVLRNKLQKNEIPQEYQTKERIEKKTPDNDRDSKTKGNRVSNEIKVSAVHLVDIHPKNSARSVALSLRLEFKTVQRWYRS